ncbi:lipoprotein [Undibacterium sp. FT137W]|uniref:Lipoprotein n=2 Tax=Undibacterium fentianense TaxID=2828728 RepID=A0A941IEZ3_9BURK|nr:lipoprotein [Undibacterium fentianense]
MLLGTLSACGQKGPLFIPEKKTAPSTPSSPEKSLSFTQS